MKNLADSASRGGGTRYPCTETVLTTRAEWGARAGIGDARTRAGTVAFSPTKNGMVPPVLNPGPGLSGPGRRQHVATAGGSSAPAMPRGILSLHPSGANDAATAASLPSPRHLPTSVSRAAHHPHSPRAGASPAGSSSFGGAGHHAAFAHAGHHHNHAPTRCRLAHHSILLPPAAFRHDAHRDGSNLAPITASAAAAAAAVAAERRRLSVVASAMTSSASSSSSSSDKGDETGGSDVEFHDARIPAWVTLTRRRWDAVTMSMASAATVPFLFLTMPQILKNASLIAAGRPEALAAIAWQGQVAGLLGNLLLLSYFADKGELSASVVQGVGVCATGALLTQITLAGHIPVGAFVVAAAAVLVGLVVSLARMLGRVGPVDANGVPCVGNVQCHLSFAGDAQGALQTRLQVVSNGLWGFYQGALAVVGLAALPQVGLKSLLPAETAARVGLAPGATGAALGVVLVVLGRAGKLPPALATAWGRLSGWTATLLFMTMPVAQLAANFASPATLEGLSVLSSLLAMLGNALMVPRALYTRDVIWLTGSTWGCTLMGWGVMLSLFLGRHADGTRYVSAWSFSALTAGFFAYLAVVWIVDGVSALAAGYHAGWRLKAWNFQGMSVEQPRADIRNAESE